MPLNPESYEPKRLEYYAGKLKRQRLPEPQNGVSGAFLVKGHFFGDGEYLHHFEYYDSEHGVSRRPDADHHDRVAKLGQTVEKTAGEMTKPEKWAAYFRYITDKSNRAKINTITDDEEGIAMA